MATQQQKGAAFKALHEAEGAFIIPNPWDAGSAQVLAGLGFEALATTSSGLAFALGKPDGALAVSAEEALENARSIVEATGLPVSADLENGYAHPPQEAAKIVSLAAGVGLVGCSIEDWSGDTSIGIYDIGLATERIEAAVAAVRSLDIPFTLTARAENLIRGREDLDDTIRRLQAFEEAGADVLYAPGLSDVESIRAVTSAVGKPVNTLAYPANAHLSLADHEAAGAKRVSVGGTLSRIATGAFLAGAKRMAELGVFDSAAGAVGLHELEELMRLGSADGD